MLKHLKTYQVGTTENNFPPDTLLTKARLFRRAFYCLNNLRPFLVPMPNVKNVPTVILSPMPTL